MIEMKKNLLSIKIPPSKRKTILLFGSHHLSYGDSCSSKKKLFTSNGQYDNGPYKEDDHKGNKLFD